jgi:TetR/AcrR family transcriptional regulator, regulator of cefoperazone and chloramphenicol sensitivity
MESIMADPQDQISEQGVGLEETRQRVLEVAGEMFSQRGFRETTIREICHAARANVAAVNYHFRDKDGLYTAVLLHAHQVSMSRYPPDMGVSKTDGPQKRLDAFVRSFLFRIFDRGPHAWLGKLIAREMMEPTGALDQLVVQQIRPRAELLEGIIRELIGPEASAQTVKHCAASVVGQCLFYHHARPLLERLYPEQGYEPEAVESLARHITGFSLAAMKGVCE